jgi:hypothetical protein
LIDSLKRKGEQVMAEGRFPWREIVVAVVSAAATGLLGVFASSVTDGRIIDLMGGVSKTELRQEFKAALDGDPALKNDLRGEQGPPGVKGDRGEPGQSVSLRSGAVIASTVECAVLGDEWTVFTEAGGRFILGAGSGTDPNGVTESFTPNKRGGEYKHSLQVEEMPPHSHKIKRGNKNANDDIFFDAVGNAAVPNTLETEREGDGKAFYIIPPYITLTFCKKV